MAETSNEKRYVAFVVGYFECLLFGSTIPGWPSLLYLIKEDGIYRYTCQHYSPNTNESFNDSEVPSKACAEEENVYNLAFGIALTLQHMSPLFSAFFLEYIGLRKTRFFNSFLFFSAGIILRFATRDRPYLLFVGMILIATASGQQRLIDFQIANFFPTARTTVLSLYVGANIGASGVFALFQYANDYAAINWNMSFLIYGGLSLLMLLPTFFLLPDSLVHKAESTSLPKESQTNDNETTPLLREKEYNGEVKVKSNFQPATNCNPSFRQSVFSFSYLIFLYAFFITSTFAVTYNGAFNWWVDQTIDDANTAKWLSQIFGNLQFTSMVLQPLLGYSVDTCLRKAKLEKDVSRRMQYERWTIAVLLTFLTSISIVTLIMTFHNSVTIITTSIACYVLTRCFVAFMHPVYIRLSFPSSHFNKLFGITGVIVATAAQIQHLLFLWIQKDYFTPRWTLLALLALTYTSPFYQLYAKKTYVPLE